MASVRGMPWWFETPKLRPGNPSVLKLPVLIELADGQGVDISAFVQCSLGAPTVKLTEIMHSSLCMADFPTECTHEIWWAMLWSGEELFAAHPILTGT